MKIIGISGLAGDGKDSACQILRNYFAKYGFITKRFAFGDEVKQECRKALINLYRIDPTNCDRLSKERIRDYLVFYAKVKRLQTDGTYWVDRLRESIEKHVETSKVSSNFVACIPDVRHAEYKKDELSWIKENGGILIHVKKFSFDNSSKQNRIYTTPINNEEAKHTPKLEALADYVVEWQDCFPQLAEDNKLCIDAVEKIGSAILSQWAPQSVSIETKNTKKHSKTSKNGA